MIPTMIVFGLVLGRWWRTTLALAAVLWPALLVADGVLGAEPALVAASLFGVANAMVGVAVHQGILWAARRLLGTRRRRTARRPSGSSTGGRTDG